MLRTKISSYISNFQCESFTISEISKIFNITRKYAEEILIDIYNSKTIDGFNVMYTKTRHKVYYVGDILSATKNHINIYDNKIKQRGSCRIMTPLGNKRTMINYEVQKQVKEQIANK